jgi:hypothetical protein
MPDEQNGEHPPADSIKTITENPMILDKVDYAYSSYAQVSINNLDFRIAFGDRMPPDGAVKPIVGIVMSHDNAKSLLEVLSTNVPKIDRLREEMAKREGKIGEQPQKG